MNYDYKKSSIKNFFCKDPIKYLISQLTDREEWIFQPKATNCDNAWLSKNNDFIVFNGDYVCFGNLEEDEENRFNRNDIDFHTAQYLLFG